MKQWTAVVEGVFREVQYLATGLSTERVPEDEHHRADGAFHEGQSRTEQRRVDEHSRIEIVEK